MIPKIIHYCWFGRGPLPKLAQKCIDSWRKYLPDYEIREWNEDNFDVNIIPYTAEAYQLKKYAFVSDYARFWILFHYGGIYFDTDVEVIKPIDDIIKRGPFMGFETDPTNGFAACRVAPGLGLGANMGNGMIKKFLDWYDSKHFEMKDLTKDQITVVTIATSVLKENGLKAEKGIQKVEDIWIYPREYFCPINVTTNHLTITKNTRTIHHYAGSWINESPSLKNSIKKYVPEWMLLFFSNIKRKLKIGRYADKK